MTRIQSQYPTLEKHPDIKHTFEVFNPGRNEATIVIPGLNQEDVERFRRGRMFGQIVEELDDTVILFNWPLYTYMPEYTAAQLEDLCLQEGISKVKLIGASYGGHVALELVADIERNGTPIELTGLITIVSPVDAEDLRVGLKLEKRVAPMLQAVEMTRVLLARGNVEEKLKHARRRSAVVRVSAFKNKPYTREEMPNNVPVLAITTQGEPLWGEKGGPPTPDLLVKNQQAASKLERLFDNVEIMQVRGRSLVSKGRRSLSGSLNLPGAHAIVAADVPMINDRIMEFLSSVDKEK
jgi:pimeloyl-ACP methyl ester carboxylesterase